MRHVVFVAVPPIQILDLTAPFEIFSRAGGYRVELATTAEDGQVRSSCGLTLANAVSYRRIRAPIDTLLVPGGEGSESVACDDRFLLWLASNGSKARRTGSICTGAFLLASAGLLDGRRAVTHWGWCAKLAQEFPKVKVERDPIYIRDGSFYTSAGVTAGLDLALALVEEDQGREHALSIARDLVMYLRRAGGQSQFSRLLDLQDTEADKIGHIRSWILENPNADLSVAALARHCGIGARQFARTFAAKMGDTPARYVEQLRVETARVVLEGANYSLKEAAVQCGFGSADSMRRSFLRVLGVTPGDYAKRFSAQFDC